MHNVIGTRWSIPPTRSPGRAVFVTVGGLRGSRPRLARTVVAAGVDVDTVVAGDAVLGRLQNWDARAELVTVPADQVVPKPPTLE